MACTRCLPWCGIVTGIRDCASVLQMNKHNVNMHVWDSHATPAMLTCVTAKFERATIIWHGQCDSIYCFPLPGGHSVRNLIGAGLFTQMRPRRAIALLVASVPSPCRACIAAVVRACGTVSSQVNMTACEHVNSGMAGRQT